MSAENPSRRSFIVASSAGVLSSALLAACGTSSVVNSSGTVPTTSIPPTAPPTTADEKEIAAGIAALRTATSIEHSIDAFYDAFAKAPYLDAATKARGATFQAHHQANAKSLESLTVTAGGKAFSKVNAYVDSEVVNPQLALANEAKSATQLIALAATLEDLAASNGTLAVGTLARQPERVGIMEVAAANARHATAWKLDATSDDPASALPDPLYSLKNALGTAGAVDK